MREGKGGKGREKEEEEENRGENKGIKAEKGYKE